MTSAHIHWAYIVVRQNQLLYITPSLSFLPPAEAAVAQSWLPTEAHNGQAPEQRWGPSCLIPKPTLSTSALTSLWCFSSRHV